MLVSLDQAQARLAMSRRDPDVRQTAVEAVRRAPADRPGVLDASIFSGAFEEWEFQTTRSSMTCLGRLP